MINWCVSDWSVDIYFFIKLHIGSQNDWSQRLTVETSIPYNTPGRRQSNTLSTIDVREKVFSIAICRRIGDKWQAKTLFLSIFDLRSSIVLAFSIAAYPVCISKASCLWDMGKHRRPRSNAAECGVWSDQGLYCLLTECSIEIWIKM